MIDEAIKAGRADKWPYINRGIAFRKNGDLPRALADFNAAIKIDPSDPNSFVERGTTYLELSDDLNRAADDYDTAIKLDPKSAKAHSGLAICFSKKGKFAEAIAEDLAAIQADKRYVLPIVNLGTHYLLNGDIDKAFEAYHNALKVRSFLSKKALSAVHYGLGNIFLKRNNIRAAIIEYSFTIGYNKFYKSAYSARANLYEIQDDLIRAENDRRMLKNLSK